ncbi:hypothetical protein UNH65_18080 [Chitinophaga sp. 180180018-2]|nr:hypothetical protein [Chitinophaga sp. 212800010-3]
MSGYIFEQNNQVLFIPMDTNKDFLSQLQGKDAYRIYEYPGYEAAKYSQEDSIQIEAHYYDSVTKHDVGIKENIYLVRVNIIYVDDNNSRSPEKAKIEFEYDGKQYLFTAYANRFTQVYQVVGVTSVLDRR